MGTKCMPDLQCAGTRSLSCLRARPRRGDATGTASHAIEGARNLMSWLVRSGPLGLALLFFYEWKSQQSWRANRWEAVWVSFS